MEEKKEEEKVRCFVRLTDSSAQTFVYRRNPMMIWASVFSTKRCLGVTIRYCTVHYPTYDNEIAMPLRDVLSACAVTILNWSLLMSSNANIRQ